MEHSSSVAEKLKPVFRTPGAQLTKDDLRRAEEYFEHHEGVVVHGTDWSEDDLGEPDGPLAAEKPVA